MHKFLCERKFSFILDTNPGVGFLGHVLSVRLTLEETLWAWFLLEN